jgi:hypothetical protein
MLKQNSHRGKLAFKGIFAIFLGIFCVAVFSISNRKKMNPGTSLILNLLRDLGISSEVQFGLRLIGLTGSHFWMMLPVANSGIPAEDVNRRIFEIGSWETMTEDKIAIQVYKRYCNLEDSTVLDVGR